MNRELLRKHFEQTPLMQPTDALKLVYQHAFGCGHMSPYQQSHREWLKRELDEAEVSPDVPLATPIGGGLCRLNLASPRVNALGGDVICSMMAATNVHVLKRDGREFLYEGNELRYDGGLNDVLAMICEGRAAFSKEEWEKFLDWHREQGRPAVSHSEIYREAYRPSYRVVMEDCAALIPVIEKMKAGGHQAVVVDGPCGSGKTTLGQILREVLQGIPVPMDDFFLPSEMRTEERLAQIGGNIHHERFKAEILDKFEIGKPLKHWRFDCQTGKMQEESWPARDVLVIEGSYSHHPAFEGDYQRLNALKVYVDVEPEEQLRRLALRNPKSLEMFTSRWIPLEKTYFEAYDIKDRADIVLKSQPWMEDER